MLVEEPLKPGQVIEFEYGKYKVLSVYSHHVLLEDLKTKIKRDVMSVDLMLKGLVKQKGARFEVEKQIKNMGNDCSDGFGVANFRDKS